MIMYDDEDEEVGFLLCIKIPDLQSQTRIVVKQSDSVFTAKQSVLSKLQDLPYDKLNYGLYLMPTMTGRPGKFLDDGRLLSEYALSGVSELEFQYKRRDYSLCQSLTNKAIGKANNKSNQKKIIDLVTHGSVKKIEKLLDSGLDPNFVHDDGNTPLGVACGRNGKVDCIPALLSGGAHIDFRGSGGLTPIHRAAIGGNTQAMKNLLSLGSSPHYTDDKGLTPLYHAAIMGDDIGVSEALLKQKAVIGQVDQIGWTELHQIAKHGNKHLVDMMLHYGADIDAQNDTGNTPLHVAAQHGKLDVAVHLMRRGADREICNGAGQPPNQVAILCGHRSLAKEIQNFSDNKKEPLKREPQSSTSRLQVSPVHSTNTLPSKGRHANRTKLQNEYADTKQRYHQSTLGRNYTNEVCSSQEDIEEIEPIHLSTGSSSSGSSQNSPQRHRYSDKRKIKTASPISISTPLSSSHSSPSRSISTSPSPVSRERLYACSPGKKYTVTKDIMSQQHGDLSLSKGMEVEVLYIGKANYWEGMVGNKRGWFPQTAISAVPSGPKTSLLQNDKDVVSKSLPVNVTTKHDSVSPKSHPPHSGGESTKEKMKSITIHKGPKGFGFAMRGVKTVNVNTFKPDASVPALQYVGEVDEGGAASCAGLEQGDFIVEVNGVDTTYATHLDVVNIIKKAGGTLQMKVTVPAQKPKSKSSTDTLKSPKNNEPKSSPKKDEKEQDKIDERKKNKDETSQKNKNMSAISKAASSPTSSKLSNRPEQLEKPSTQKHISENTTNQRKQEPATTTIEETADSKQTPLSSTTPTGAISRISPMSRSKKGNESPINQSPLLHSIRYEDKKQPEMSSLRNEVSDQPNTKENSKAKETKMNEETNKEEEELSEFAKQLRKAAMNRNNRVSAEKPKVTKTSKTNQTKKNDEFGSHIVSLERKGTQKTTDNDIELVNHTNKESKPKENNTSTSAKEQKGVFPFSPGNNSGAVSPSWGGSSNYDDNDSDDGWTEVAPDDMKDFNVSTSSDRNSPSQLLKSPQTENTIPMSSVSPKSSSFKKKESKSQTSNESSSNKPNTVKPSKSNSANSKSPENTNSISLKQKSNKNNTKTHKPSTSKPPPVAEKPSRKKPNVISKERDHDKEKEKIKKPDNGQTENEGVEEEIAVTFPVLSLKHKFESMSSGSPKLATNKNRSDDSHVKSPLLPLSSKKKMTVGESNFQNSANSSLSYKSSPQTVGKTDSTKPTAKSEKKIIRVTNELPPPLDTALDEDLPLPLPISDDEEFPRLEGFSPPPPPLILTDDSESDREEDEGEYVPPPPPLYDDMDDADLFDDDPPIYDAPVSLNELMDKQDILSSSPSKDKNGGKEETDLLDNIVEQLKTLATTTSQESSDNSDAESDRPPPLPSSPPPIITDEDQDEGRFFDAPVNAAVIEEEHSLPNTSQNNNNVLLSTKLSPVVNDLPPIDKLPDELSPLDQLPLPDEELLPPPAEELPSPQTLEAEEHVFEFEPVHILPPPDSLPPPVVLSHDDDTDDIEFEDSMLFIPPPPLDQFEGEESDLPIMEDVTLPPPVELLPEHMPSVQPLDIPINKEEVSKTSLKDWTPSVSGSEIHKEVEALENESSFATKPLDLWTSDDVCHWLAEVGLDSHIATFTENEILGEHLRDLTRDDLKDLGITKIGHIKTFKQKLEPYLT